MSYTTETDSGYQIKIPFQFRGYKIEKPCGRGAFSSVIKVTDMTSNIPYAAKIIPKKALKNEARITTMINNEIEILQQTNHPNIIRLYEIIELTTKDDCFMILIEEFCENGNLFEYLMKKKENNQVGFKNDQERFQISRGITEAIGHLHMQRIAHCDIKPENILLNSQNIPKLCDFNLSQLINKADDTSRGGSKSYAAPELFKFEKIDFLRADIWSLGVMIFSIAEMRYPFDDDDDGRNGILFFCSKNKKLNAFSKRCLKVDPTKRATIFDLLDDPYLTSQDEIDDEDDEQMIAKAKNEAAQKKMKTTPNLADAKKMQEEQSDDSELGLPSNLINDDELEEEMSEDIFELVYGYRKSSLELNNSSSTSDLSCTVTTIYKRESPGSSVQNVDHSQDNDSNSNAPKRTVSSSSGSGKTSKSHADVRTEQGSPDDDGNSDDSSNKKRFSVMLELGYDFKLQKHLENSKSATITETGSIDEIESSDDDNYEIEKVEKRISDSIVKWKFEKVMKPKTSYIPTRRKMFDFK